MRLGATRIVVIASRALDGAGYERLNNERVIHVLVTYHCPKPGLSPITCTIWIVTRRFASTRVHTVLTTERCALMPLQVLHKNGIVRVALPSRASPQRDESSASSSKREVIWRGTHQVLDMDRDWPFFDKSPQGPRR